MLRVTLQVSKGLNRYFLKLDAKLQLDPIKMNLETYSSFTELSLARISDDFKHYWSALFLIEFG